MDKRHSQSRNWSKQSVSLASCTYMHNIYAASRSSHYSPCLWSPSTWGQLEYEPPDSILLVEVSGQSASLQFDQVDWSSLVPAQDDPRLFFGSGNVGCLELLCHATISSKSDEAIYLPWIILSRVLFSPYYRHARLCPRLCLVHQPTLLRKSMSAS